VPSSVTNRLSSGLNPLRVAAPPILSCFAYYSCSSSRGDLCALHVLSPFFATWPGRSDHSLVTDRRSWSQEAIAYAVATASDAVSSNLLKRSQSKKPLSLAMQNASPSDSQRLANLPHRVERTVLFGPGEKLTGVSST
jgi:hypothetical protein